MQLVLYFCQCMHLILICGTTCKMIIFIFFCKQILQSSVPKISFFWHGVILNSIKDLLEIFFMNLYNCQYFKLKHKHVIIEYFYTTSTCRTILALYIPLPSVVAWPSSFDNVYPPQIMKYITSCIRERFIWLLSLAILNILNRV